MDKHGLLASFQQQNPRVIVATSTLRIGIDIPDIQLMIHIGQTQSLLDCAQESGRAGHDGGASEAIMLIDGQGWGWNDPPTVDSRIQEYVMGGCRRRALDIYLDGTVDGYTRQQCEAGEVMCGQCQAVISPSDVERNDCSISRLNDGVNDNTNNSEASKATTGKGNKAGSKKGSKEDSEKDNKEDREEDSKEDSEKASKTASENSHHFHNPISSGAVHKRAISKHSNPPIAKRQALTRFPSTAYYQAPRQRQMQDTEADSCEIKSIHEQFDRWAGQC